MSSFPDRSAALLSANPWQDLHFKSFGHDLIQSIKTITATFRQEVIAMA